jgi:hypothetical protein
MTIVEVSDGEPVLLKSEIGLCEEKEDVKIKDDFTK